MLVGVFSALGLAFLLSPRWLLPMTATLLVMALAFMAREARRRRVYAPLAVGVVAAGGMLVGKFGLESDALMFGSMALLVLASIANGLGRRRRKESVMSQKRVFEVFSAGCAVCDDVIGELKREACPSCDVRIQDMSDPDVAARARALGIRSVPAVVVDGRLADCCAGRGVDLERLKELGLGRPV